MTIIEFDDVRFSYAGSAGGAAGFDAENQSRDLALNGISLSLDEGSFTCIIGGNGSGKSTLARHMNALLVPTSGTVRIDGLDTAERANTFTIRQTVSMVFQNPDDQIVASIVEDDVAFGPENLGLPADEIAHRVSEALARVGLQGFKQRQTHTLSGGLKQRVAIAGALAMKPQVLVLDEPGAMLDPAGRHALARTCHELNDKGLSVVLITHFMEEAAEADRVIALDKGRVVLDGTPDDVLVQTELLESLNLETPYAARISRALQKRGFDIPTSIREEDLIEDLIEFTRRHMGCQ